MRIVKEWRVYYARLFYFRDTFFLLLVALRRGTKRRCVRTSVREDRIQMRKGKREGRDLEKKQRKKRKEACAIILGRASPLGPGHDDDNNNLNRAHLAYV